MRAEIDHARPDVEENTCVLAEIVPTLAGAGAYYAARRTLFQIQPHVIVVQGRATLDGVADFRGFQIARLLQCRPFNVDRWPEIASLGAYGYGTRSKHHVRRAQFRLQFPFQPVRPIHRIRQVRPVSFRRTVIGPGHQCRYLFVAEREVVLVFLDAYGGIEMPGRHDSAANVFPDQRRPDSHLLVCLERHRTYAARLMATLALLLQNPRDFVRKSRRLVRLRSLQTVLRNAEENGRCHQFFQQFFRRACAQGIHRCDPRRSVIAQLSIYSPSLTLTRTKALVQQHQNSKSWVSY